MTQLQASMFLMSECRHWRIIGAPLSDRLDQSVKHCFSLSTINTRVNHALIVLTDGFWWSGA